MTTKTLIACVTAALLMTPAVTFAQDADEAPSRIMKTPEEAAAEKAAAEEEASSDDVEETSSEEVSDEEWESMDEDQGEADASTSAEAAPAQSGSLVYEDGGIANVGLVIGAKVGGGFSQVTSPLGTSFVGELELGYTLPLPDPVNRDLQFFTSFSYSGPSTDEKVTDLDPRLPGSGGWEYELTLQQFIITPGLLYRIPVPADWVRPYVAAGMRIYLTRTEVSGEAGGQKYGDNEETATDYGGYGALGADFFIGGPGSLLFETQFGYSAIDGTVLRNTNSGALNVAIGYRIFI